MALGFVIGVLFTLAASAATLALLAVRAPIMTFDNDDESR